LHTTKIINFIAYFNRTSQALIAEANKLENRILIPQYSPPNLPEKTRDFVTEMKAVGATYDLGDRETEVMILYAAGCSAKQIAEMFDRSLCTVETHITRIYKKTGCKDRKELNIYVRNLVLTGLSAGILVKKGHWHCLLHYKYDSPSFRALISLAGVP